MLTHLFKLIWNKKKQNFLMITEMFVSFLVIFAVFSMLVYKYNNYKVPVGFDFKDVWVVNYNDAIKPVDADSVALYMNNIRQSLKSLPGVVDVSFASGNVPFSFNTNNTELNNNGKKYRSNIFTVEANYASLFKNKMIEGRWYDKSDIPAKPFPIVINQTLKREIFGNENALGKTIIQDKEKLKIIGVVADMKDRGEYETPEAGYFNLADTGAYKWNSTILVRVQPDVDAAFEAKLFKTLNNVIYNANIEIEHFDDKEERKNKISLVPLIILVVVAGFLIINVALGLFGVLWYNISKRRGEIGLRRAIGASGNMIAKQLIAEALILSTLSLLLGSFFAIQFPLMNVFDMPSQVYYTAMLLAIIFIYLLVLVCALYPGKQAAAIMPAVALHED